MIDVEHTIIDRVKTILAIARKNLLETGSQLPMAILHTFEGVFPIVLPFKDVDQKQALIEFVKDQALEKQAFAVSTITCAKIVDSRTGENEESIVIATAVQGGRPYYASQSYVRGPDRQVLSFGEEVEGDSAATPGQMMILPEWDLETRH